MVVVQRCKWFSAMFLLLVLASSVALGDDHENTMNQRQTQSSIIHAAKRLFSPPPALKIKALFQQGWSYFRTPPNLDFRGGSDESMKENEGTGAGGKVKEAAVKSLGKSKAAVEDSAKSAANLAEDTVEKTVKKLKKTLSGSGAAHHEPEL